MESAPARAQSRIPPFRLSKTVQPAPHKGQRRWLPHFSRQSSSADAKKRRKKARLSKMPSQPARDKGCGTQCLDTHNAACGIETPQVWTAYRQVHCLDTHNAACGIETANFSSTFLMASAVSTHTMLRAALKRIRFDNANSM